MKTKFLFSLVSLIAISGLVSCNRTMSPSTDAPTSDTAPSTDLPTSDTTPDLPSSTYPEDVFSIISYGDAYTGAKIVLACRIDKGLLAPEDQFATEYTITEGQELASIVDGRYIQFNEEVGSITVNGTLEKDEKTYSASLELDIQDFLDDANTVVEVKNSEVGTEITTAGVVTAFVGTSGFYLSDETQTIYVYGSNTAKNVKRGDEVVISGIVAEYNGAIQIASPVLERTREASEYPDPSAYIDTSYADVQAVHAAENIAGKTIKLTGKITKRVTDYTSYSFEDDSNFLSIYSNAGDSGCPENAWLDPYVKSGETVTVAFYINSKNSSGYWRGNIIYIFDEEAAPQA